MLLVKMLKHYAMNENAIQMQFEINKVELKTVFFVLLQLTHIHVK